MTEVTFWPSTSIAAARLRWTMRALRRSWATLLNAQPCRPSSEISTFSPGSSSAKPPPQRTLISSTQTAAAASVLL